MCGRYTLRTPAREIAEFFHLIGTWDAADLPRFNIAPTQLVLGVRHSPAGREAAFLRWGLVPSWAADLSAGTRCINARSEELATRRS